MTDSSGILSPAKRTRRLGKRHNDASPGDHSHNGANSKKVKLSEIFSDAQVVNSQVTGAFVTTGAGQINIPHALGVIPKSVFFFPSTSADRGFYTHITSNDTTTTVCIECYSAGNVIRGGGVNVNGQVLIVA